MSSFGGFNNLFQRTTSALPSLTNLYLNRNKDSRGREIPQTPAQTPEGQAVQKGDVASLVDQQVLGTEKVQTASIADRDRALQLLEQFIGQNNALGNQVSESIQSGLQNPDVLSDEDIARLEARFNSIRSRGLQDQIDQTSTDFAGRGIAGSGLQAGQTRALNEQALQDVLRNVSDLAVQQSALRNQNLNELRGLGSNLSTSERGFDQRLTELMAQYLANTNREAPDLSGFASLAADTNQAGFDNLIQAALTDQLTTQQNQSQAVPFVSSPLNTPFGTNNGNSAILNSLLERLVTNA